MTRWAKVPEWLPIALVTAEQSACKPGNALLAFTIVRVRFSDFRTNEAEVAQAELAGCCAFSRATAARALGLLVVVGALAPLGHATRWRARARYRVAVDEPLSPVTGEHHAMHTTEQSLVTDEHLANGTSAGQTPGRPSLVSITTNPGTSSVGAEDQERSVWDDLAGAPSLFDIKGWLGDRRARLDQPIPVGAHARRAARMPPTNRETP